MPKYEIMARGESLFFWSLSSLRTIINDACHFVFVCQKEESPLGFIKTQCKSLGISNYELIYLDQITSGQATTALLAGPAIRNYSTPLVIYNIDTFIEPNHLNFNPQDVNGFISCFQANGTGWSFVRTDGKSNRVVEVREKQKISSNASIGLYYFSSFEIYRNSYMKYYSNGLNRVYGEKYVAPIYNQIIEDGGIVRMGEIESNRVHHLGIPTDVERFNSLEGDFNSSFQ